MSVLTTDLMGRSSIDQWIFAAGAFPPQQIQTSQCRHDDQHTRLTWKLPNIWEAGKEFWDMCRCLLCLSVHCYSRPVYGEGSLNICARVCVCVFAGYLDGVGERVCSACSFPQSFTPVNTISSFELYTFCLCVQALCVCVCVS